MSQAQTHLGISKRKTRSSPFDPNSDEHTLIFQMCVNVCYSSHFLPANGYVPKVRILRGCPWFKIGHIKVGQSVVDEAVHGPGLAEHVLVH